MSPTKQFKNRRGDMPWYVVALILAIVVLLVSLGAIYKIRQNQGKADEQAGNACVTVAKGTCVEAAVPCSGGSNPIPGLCPAGKVCCAE